MAKHMPAIAWGLHKPGASPNGYVSTASPKELRIELYPIYMEPGFAFKLSRREAKLLARRITQCLEKTK